MYRWLYSWADFIIIGLLLLSVLVSIMRGLVREILSLLTWFLAFYVAIVFSKPFASLLATHIKSPSVQMITAFSVLFIGVLILGTWVSHLTGKAVDGTGLSGLDRLLGIVFGLIRGALLVAVLILLAHYTTLPRESWWKESTLIPRFQPITAWLKEFMPTTLKIPPPEKPKSKKERGVE